MRVVHFPGLLFCCATMMAMASGQDSRPDKVHVDALGDSVPSESVARLGTHRMRVPTGYVPSPAISPDGKLLAVTGAGSQVRIWDAITGKEIRRLCAPGDCIWGPLPVFSPDGGKLVVEYRQKDVPGVVVWEFPSGRELHRFSVNRAEGYAFADAGKTLVVVDGDGIIRRWDLMTGAVGQSWDPLEEPRKLGKDGVNFRIANAALSPDGEVLAVQWDLARRYQLMKVKSSFQVINLAKKKELWSIGIDDNSLIRMAFSDDGQVLACALPEGRVEVRETPTGRMLDHIKGPTLHKDPSYAHLAFSANGKTVVITETDKAKTALVWDLAGAKKHEIPLGPHRLSRVWGGHAALFPDGKRLTLAVNDQLHIWDLVTRKETLTLPGHRETIHHLHFSKDGKTLVTGISGPVLDYPLFGNWGYPLQAITWSTVTWAEIGRSVVPESWPLKRPAAASPVHALSVAFKDAKTLQLRSFAEDKPIRDLKAKPEKAWQPNGIISPDGNLLLIKDDAPEEPIILPPFATREFRTSVIDLESGQRIGSIPINSNRQRVAFAQGKPLLAWITYDLRIGLFDPNKQPSIRYLKDPSPRTVIDWIPMAFSTDGRYLAEREWGAGKPKVVIWDLTSQKVWREFTVEDDAEHLVFSRDNNWLALSGRNAKHTVLLIEATTGKVHRRLVGHEGKVTALAWSPDGRFLASGSEDTTVLIWDMAKLAAKR